MKTIEFLICCEAEEAATIINNATQCIEEYSMTRNKKEFDILFGNIRAVIAYWAGHTYVGFRKERILSDAFQSFFLALRGLVETLMSSHCSPKEKKFVIKIRFFGRVYRYLGHGDCMDAEGLIQPEYSDIFVSWSKNQRNGYFERKLYGPITLLTCEIREPDWGFDLELFDLRQAHEKEVVFPTKQESIVDASYKNIDDNPEDYD